MQEMYRRERTSRTLHSHTIPHAHSNLLAPAAIWGTQKEGHVPWCGDSRTGAQGVVSSHNGWLVGIIDDD